MRKAQCCFVVAAGLAVGLSAPAGGAQAGAYRAAAPMQQYMMNREAELAMARSAAPPSISGHAEVLVLTDHGYAAAVNGDNGFTCLVERAWAKSTDDAEFWNPKVRAPHCLNTAAVKTYLPIVILKTKLVLAGKSAAEIGVALRTAWSANELPALAPNAMCYMMSKQQYLSDSDRQWHPHMMWYLTGDAEKSWQANAAGVPALVGYVPEDHMTVMLVKVERWSDGAPAEITQ